MNLILQVTNDGLTDLTPLNSLEPSDLFAISFACTRVKDDDRYSTARERRRGGLIGRQLAYARGTVLEGLCDNPKKGHAIFTFNRGKLIEL